MKVSKVLHILVFLILLSSCDLMKETKREEAFEFGSGNSDLVDVIETMDSPQGVLPYTVPVSDIESYTFKSTEDYYEFFVFDKNRAVIILSVEPMYYLVINSSDFYMHLTKELEQINSGASPKNKIASTVPYLKEIGDYRIEVYFTPSEMRYSSGLLADNNNTSHVDPHKLYKAAKSVFFYTPTFKEEQIYSDLLLKFRYQDGADVLQYTRESGFAEGFNSSYVTWYEDPSLFLNFTVMLGDDLIVNEIDVDEIENWNELTEAEQINIDPNLGETGILGYSELYFEDQKELTEEFSLFITTPLGNSSSAAEAFLADTDSGRHGIAVLIRGPQDIVRDFLTSEGIDFNPTETLPVSLLLADKYDDKLYLEWTEERNVTVQVSSDGETYSAASVASQTTTEAAVSNLSRGNKYYFRLIEKDSGAILAESSTYFTDIILTEICHAGSSFMDLDSPSKDDWVEVKNISSSAININEYDFILYNTTPTEKFWFGPSNEGTASHDAIDYLLEPGEYVVFAARADDGKENTIEYFFSEDAFGTPDNVIRAGTTSDTISAGYNVKIVHSDNVCQYLEVDSNLGGKQPWRTMVLKSNGEWGESEHDSGFAPNDDEDSKNYCSPGTRADGEL